MYGWPMEDLADKGGPGGEGIAVAVQKATDRSSNTQISTAAAFEYGRDGKRFWGPFQQQLASGSKCSI